MHPSPRPAPATGPTRRHRAWPAAALAVAVLAVSATACSGGDGGSVDAVATTAPGPATTPSGPTTSDTGVPPSTTISGGAASVDLATVTFSPSGDGSWQAAGLVANDTGDTAGDILVVATLTGRDGSVLGTASADSPVGAVRAGERVPFSVVASGVALDDVASVAWQAASRPGPDTEAGRGLATSTYWTRPYGDSHLIDLPAYRDPSGGPYPFVLYASLANPGAAPVGSPSLALAWTDADGRVIAVASGRGMNPDGTRLDALAPGASADVLVVVDDPGAGPRLADLTPTTWTSGS